MPEHIKSTELFVPTFEIATWPVLTRDPLTGITVGFDIAKTVKDGVPIAEAVRRGLSRSCGRIRFVDLADADEMENDDER